MIKIKYFIAIIILSCLPGLTQLNRFSGITGMDTVYKREGMIFPANDTNADSSGNNSCPVPEDQQEADSNAGNINHPGNGWHWFISINIYPDILKTQ